MAAVKGDPKVGEKVLFTQSSEVDPQVYEIKEVKEHSILGNAAGIIVAGKMVWVGIPHMNHHSNLGIWVFRQAEGWLSRHPDWKPE